MDESAPKDKALVLWRPVPFPGYVAMGCICTIGTRAPGRTVVRCVRRAQTCSCCQIDVIEHDID